MAASGYAPIRDGDADDAQAWLGLGATMRCGRNRMVTAGDAGVA